MSMIRVGSTLKLEGDIMTVCCDNCITNDAAVVIVLDNGLTFNSCIPCIVPTIQREATTDNPIHSIEEM